MQTWYFSGSIITAMSVIPWAESSVMEPSPSMFEAASSNSPDMSKEYDWFLCTAFLEFLSRFDKTSDRMKKSPKRNAADGEV